jgi:hypothetical protein
MRFVNRVLGAVVAIAVVAIGVLLVIEVISASFNGDPLVVHWHVMLRWARRTTWDASIVQSTCVLLAVIGVVLLVLELKRRRPKRFRVRSDATDAAFTRRALKAAVQAAVADVDGISESSASVGRRRIKVRATMAGVARHTADELEAPVRAAADSRLQSLELDPTPRLITHVVARSR